MKVAIQRKRRGEKKLGHVPRKKLADETKSGVSGSVCGINLTRQQKVNPTRFHWP